MEQVTPALFAAGWVSAWCRSTLQNIAEFLELDSFSKPGTKDGGLSERLTVYSLISISSSVNVGRDISAFSISSPVIRFFILFVSLFPDHRLSSGKVTFQDLKTFVAQIWVAHEQT